MQTFSFISFFFYCILFLQTMAKVLTSMLKFPPEQAQKVLEREDSRVMVSVSSVCRDSLSVTLHMLTLTDAQPAVHVPRGSRSDAKSSTYVFLIEYSMLSYQVSAVWFPFQCSIKLILYQETEFLTFISISPVVYLLLVKSLAQEITRLELFDSL